MCVSLYIYMDLLFIHVLYIHRSKYFRAMFSNGKWKESNQRYDCCMDPIMCTYRIILHVYSELETDEFSYNTYKAYLQYLYTDSVNMSPEEAVGEFFMQCLCMYSM